MDEGTSLAYQSTPNLIQLPH